MKRFPTLHPLLNVIVQEIVKIEEDDQIAVMIGKTTTMVDAAGKVVAVEAVAVVAAEAVAVVVAEAVAEVVAEVAAEVVAKVAAVAVIVVEVQTVAAAETEAD